MAIDLTVIALKKDENGFYDSYLDANNQIALLTGADAVAQNVSTNLRLWLGEYDFNTIIGMPYQNIMGENLNKSLLYSYIKDTVESTQFVTQVTAINFTQDRENRITTIDVVFDTEETKGVTANAII